MVDKSTAGGGGVTCRGAGLGCTSLWQSDVCGSNAAISEQRACRNPPGRLQVSKPSPPLVLSVDCCSCDNRLAGWRP